MEKTLKMAGDLLLFVILSMVFVPSFLIVHWLEDTWSKKLSELFGR